MKIMGNFASWAGWLLLPVLFTGLLSAQVDKATINGTVTDPSGAVVSDVQVVATNVDTGVTYPATTNSVGIYQIRALPIGHYSMRFDGPGFKGMERTGLELEVAQVAEVNVQLAIGSSSERVDVASAAPVLLETETS